MTLTFGTAFVVKPGTIDQEIEVQTAHVETDDDIRELRASDWHEGAMGVLAFPSRLVAHLNHDIPRAFGGIKFVAGATVGKDNAGNFYAIKEQ